MKEWHEGYFTELEYVDGYLAEMSPLLLQLNLTLAGVKINHADSILPIKNLSYLELGFGKGSSFNIHAAGNDGDFMGIDFNPNHVKNAIEFAQASGAKARIFDDSFEELYERLHSENTFFDIIVLHGVWSWVSIQNQEVILKIIRKFLKVGGIVYISYNTFPGWAKKHPIRELLMGYFQNTSGSAEQRITQSIAFVEEFLNKQTSFTKAFPDYPQFLAELKQHNVAYIAHEYLNQDWNCCYFTEMVKKLESNKCSFAASGKILDHIDMDIDSLELTSLKQIQDDIFKEQIKDYCINRQFRLDIFMRGKQTLGIQEGIAKISNTFFTLIKLPKTFKGTSQEGTNIFYRFILVILDFLTTDSYRPKSGFEIMEHCKLPFREFLASLCVIIHQGLVMPAQKPNQQLQQQTKKFNTHLFERQMHEKSSIYAASPITGGGIVVSEVEQLFIQGQKLFSDTHQIITFVLEILTSQNRLLANGNEQIDYAKSFQILQDAFKEFIEERLTLLQALEIC
ncbi:class I SAM-dependent methyltransferase [Helicobacter monodelphidis]|uniref:class I SAM-dependent methyltransferase n=1 Tax=Helicobacter sp. 15-1451 TaxID=2004995 RepID=UPI0015EB99D5|nr:class I SAM-dependent methyltransferase [Helicobacter sp. 15-1451]